MKRFRRFRFLLLLLYCTIPLNVAYLSIDYYSEMDLMVRKHFSTEDDEDFLALVKKNPRALYYPGLSVQHHVNSLPEISFFRFCSSFSFPEAKDLVLRC